MKIEINGQTTELPFNEDKANDWTLFQVEDVLNRIVSSEENEREDLILCVAMGLFLGKNMSNGGKAKISQITRGRTKGQWRFKLIGKNGEPVEPTNERYHNHSEMINTIKKYFSGFEITNSLG